MENETNTARESSPARYGYRFRHRLEEKEVKQKDLANKLNIEAQQVNKWCSRGVPAKYAIPVGELLDIAPDTISPQFAAGTKSSSFGQANPTEYNNIIREKVPNYSASAEKTKSQTLAEQLSGCTLPSSYFGGESEETRNEQPSPTKHSDIARSVFQLVTTTTENNSNHHWLSAPDQAMHPAINKDDLVVLDREKEGLADNAIVAIMRNEELFLRRLIYRPGLSDWVLTCDNSDKLRYPDEPPRTWQEIKKSVFGIARWRGGKIN